MPAPDGRLRFGFVAAGTDFEFARAAEELGAELLSWGESPTQFPDPYIMAARTAAVTTRALLGPVVTTPGLRHPAVLANSLVEVQRISGGRAFCGIGSGDLALMNMGERPFKVDAFVEYARVVKLLAAGEPAVWNGNTIELKLPVERPVPVWFAADGPRLIAAAGRVADGIIVGQMGGPDIVRTVFGRAAAGAAEAGRSLDDLDIWFVLRALVTEEEDGAIDVDGLDEYATRGLRYLWRTAGRPGRGEVAEAIFRHRGLRLDDDIADRLWQFNDAFDEQRAWGTKVNVELMRNCGLRDFAARYFYVSGPPERISERVRELMDAGARNFIAPFITGDALAAATDVASVLTALR
jgi:alkanesulfonate monooxygenase SsuD/methylene tetrahydromethanopterin reductase-like flavin-dependent oxidoreductase (luciferase family)